MSDETTRARLLTIGSLEWALNLPKCADDDVSRVIAYRKEIEAQCTQAAAHAETVARLKQRLDEEVATHFRCADSLMRAEADVQRLTEQNALLLRSLDMLTAALNERHAHTEETPRP